ncbi:CD302 antigen isoform X2 [Engraulis encrasicolus]|uniref:CD302 antigen isoform X2 n=1 Tax=Engraulis encrasicolus TaxID=184585 RepID=UPI002FD67F7C
MESETRQQRFCFLWRTVLFVGLWQLSRTDCPADGRTWVPFENSCYHFVHGEEDTAKSYSIAEAKKFCAANGTDLVQISSAAENEFIVKYSPSVWKGNLNVWLGMSYNPTVRKFQWFDQSDLGYKNWEVSSELSPINTCVALHLSTGKWIKVSCADDPQYGVVCQAPGETDEDCPKDGKVWKASGTRCYHYVEMGEPAKTYTFEAARELCKGYDLLQINDAEENQYIVDFGPNVWKSNINIWLGMYYDTDVDDFRWFSSNLSMSYTHYEDTADVTNGDTCAAMHLGSGQWTKVSCKEDMQHGVVCEAANKAVESDKAKNSPLLTALVVLSVVGILCMSAVLWVVHQRNNPGTSILTAFEYHPPFQSPGGDQTCLVSVDDNDEP